MTFDIAEGLQTGMLAFERSFQISEALLWSENVLDSGRIRRIPIEVYEKGLRSQTSVAKSKAEGKVVNEGGSAVHVVDAAVLPPGAEFFVISFTLRVLAGARAPFACDDPGVRANYRHLAKTYAKNGGFGYLAHRYAANILNGRFAWRNRYQTDGAEVIVQFDKRKLTVNPFKLSLDEIPNLTALKAAVVEGDDDDVDELVRGIEAGLSGKPFEVNVEWRGFMTAGAEVFPSQEYLRGDAAEKLKSKNGEGGKNRVYAALKCRHEGRDIMQASIHSQKIGAALRHIDDWHGSEEHGPIATNVFGGVQATGEVLRPSGGATPSFFAVRDNPAALFEDVEKPAEEMHANTHFFFAILLRGGVFPGEKSAGSSKKTSTSKAGGRKEKKGAVTSGDEPTAEAVNA